MSASSKIEFEKNWPSPSEDGKIPTGPFLETCQVVLQVLGNQSIFSVVLKNCLLGNNLRIFPVSNMQGVWAISLFLSRRTSKGTFM